MKTWFDALQNVVLGKEKGPSDAAVYRAYYSLKKNETLDQKLGGDGYVPRWIFYLLSWFTDLALVTTVFKYISIFFHFVF